MTDIRGVTAELRQLEEELLSSSMRYDPARARALLAPDFEEVGASGRVFGREEIISLLQGESSEERVRTLDRFRAQWLADGLVQVRYRSRQPSAAGDHHSERTSIWRRQEEGWILIYHQGTPAPPR